MGEQQYQQNIGGQQYSQGGVCPACGTQLINGVCPRCTNAQMMAAQNRNDARFTRLFMSPNEKLVATLGNNYIQNYLHNGSVRNGFAVVSDKRAYFYGTSYTISYNGRGNPNANKMSRSQVVDLKDVTGSGFIRMVNIGYAILAWALVIISIFGIMLLYDIEEGLAVIWGLAALSALLFLIYKYYDNKLSLISIQYAGGEIAFDIRWFSGQEINNFHQQLRLAKDKAAENYEYDMAKKISAAINGGKHNNLKRTVQ